MRTLPEGIPPTGQIAFVVRDLELALEQWSRLSIGPWNIWTKGPERLLQMTYHGRQQPYSMKIALCSIGPLTYELIEAVQGPNIYEEFLQQYGEGVHHPGYYVDDMSAATAAADAPTRTAGVRIASACSRARGITRPLEPRLESLLKALVRWRP